jgi:AbiV family abortive infection protein
MPASVSPKYLIEGAAYALEQCGLLLRDANLLYQNGSYASAAAVALFAQEELGRYQILLELRKKVVDGGSVTIKEIQTRCGDHVRKQEAGVMSVVMKTDKDSVLGKLLQARASATPGSREWKAANEEIKRLDRQMTKRTPSDRHKQRLSALYVDAVSPNQWNRPTNEISPTLAYERLERAANDYSIQYERYTNLEIGKSNDPEFYIALEEWTDRPTLPSPERPLLPPEQSQVGHLIAPCPSTGSVIVTTIRFQSSSSLGLRPFMLECVLPLPDWTKALLPKAMSLMARQPNKYRRR